MDNNPASPPGADLPARPDSSNCKITYRPMNILDIPQVHAIDILSFNMPWPEKSYQYELTQNRNSILWVAEVSYPETKQASRIAGMIVVWIVVDEAHIATLAIHPDFRGLGLSKALLAIGLKAAIMRGAIDSTLEVRQSNQVALQLYEKFGYHEVGLRPRYYRDNNEDAILMTVKGMGSAYLCWLETVVSDNHLKP